jgi:hypothetical protein
MTRDEILKLEANQVTDALIATKVMGLQIFQPHESNAATRLIEKGKTMGGYAHYGFPSYTTDIAAAWEVVEKMKSLGWSITILWDNNNENPGEPHNYIWLVELNYYTDNVSDFKNFYNEDLFAPIAICRAALLAVEAKK